MIIKSTNIQEKGAMTRRTMTSKYLNTERHNLMSLALLFHYLLLNMFRMIIHPSSGACDLFDDLLHGLYCSGSMCVGVTLWWCGIHMQAEALVQ